jgi:outer membrane receptor protein involved in Fe transport
VEYTGGLFFSDQIQSRGDESLLVAIQPAPGVQIPVSVGGTGAFRVTDRSMAIFGQSTIHVSPKLRLIAGGRFTNDDLKLDTFATAIPNSSASHTGLEVGKFSWKGGAQYDVSRKTMVYGTVSRGFKGGQIATPSGATTLCGAARNPHFLRTGAEEHADARMGSGHQPVLFHHQELPGPAVHHRWQWRHLLCPENIDG